jgi:hypothetical protein
VIVGDAEPIAPDDDEQDRTRVDLALDTGDEVLARAGLQVEEDRVVSQALARALEDAVRMLAAVVAPVADEDALGRAAR